MDTRKWYLSKFYKKPLVFLVTSLQRIGNPLISCQHSVPTETRIFLSAIPVTRKRQHLLIMKHFVANTEKFTRHKLQIDELPYMSLSTCAECDFVLTPPQPKPKKLEPKQACLGIDKLIQEERDNHEWNVAFQKALVKRLEASERRITLDEYLDEDMDLGGPGKRGGKRKRRKEATAATDAVTTGQAKVGTGDADAPLPKIEPVFKEKDCVCSRKIKRQERKRKRFAKIMEREQMKFEKLNMMAQRKYERERRKAYKKCEQTQLATERGYFRGGKNGGGPTAEETFSVFIHMDPGECGCRGRAACMEKFKKCFFKSCVWIYLFSFIAFFIVSYGMHMVF